MKGFINIGAVIIGAVVFVGSIFYTNSIKNQVIEFNTLKFGATITTTTLENTIGTFRINVNTAFENINDQITSSTSVDPGHKHSINSATGTITTLTATTGNITTGNITTLSTTNASTTNQSSTNFTVSNYINSLNLTITGIASTSQQYSNSSTIANLRDSQGTKYTTSTQSSMTLVAAGVTTATSTSDTGPFRNIPTASSTFNTSSTASNLRGMFIFTGTGQNSNGAGGAGCAIRVVFNNGTSTHDNAATSNGGAVSIQQNLSFTYVATSSFSASTENTMQVVFTSLVGGPCTINISSWALYLVP